MPAYNEFWTSSLESMCDIYLLLCSSMNLNYIHELVKLTNPTLLISMDHFTITLLLHNYGVTENSVLNSSRYFHVVDGLAPDIMHDILEGTAQTTLRCLIRHLVYDEKLFSLSTLNKRISSFNYGFTEQKNKPSEISQFSLQSSDTLKQSGETDL